MSVSAELITFDCYGTLVDWRSGIRDAFHEHVPASRATDQDELFAAYAEAEKAIEARAYRPYRQVLRETARDVADRFGWTLPEEGPGFLPDSLPSWPVFPDVGPALRRLADAGLRLGIVSNVDDDLLAGSLRRLPVSIDLTVTAEKVRSYKPDPAHFRAALDAVDGETGRLVHVAQSHFHDLQAAVPLAIAVVWVNREDEALPAGCPEPAAEVGTVAHAVDWIEARRAET